MIISNKLTEFFTKIGFTVESARYVEYASGWTDKGTQITTETDFIEYELTYNVDHYHAKTNSIEIKQATIYVTETPVGFEIKTPTQSDWSDDDLTLGIVTEEVAKSILEIIIKNRRLSSGVRNA